MWVFFAIDMLFEAIALSVASYDLSRRDCGALPDTKWDDRAKTVLIGVVIICAMNLLSVIPSSLYYGRMKKDLTAYAKVSGEKTCPDTSIVPEMLAILVGATALVLAAFLPGVMVAFHYIKDETVCYGLHETTLVVMLFGALAARVVCVAIGHAWAVSRTKCYQATL